jgi:peptidoglycan hydrolase CwlO-like protein
MSNYTHLENLNKQIVIGEKISILMDQSNGLMEMVKANQKEITRLKKESDQLQTHMDNATDSLKDGKQLLFESDDVEGELLKAEQ